MTLIINGKTYEAGELVAYVSKLEKENAQWKQRNETLKDALEHARKLYGDELEKAYKENAELKGLKDVATLIRANNDTVTTLMQLNNKLVSKSQQLTKAKKLLQFVSEYEDMTCYADELEEIKQFLSEVENDRNW